MASRIQPLSEVKVEFLHDPIHFWASLRLVFPIVFRLNHNDLARVMRQKVLEVGEAAIEPLRDEGVREVEIIRDVAPRDAEIESADALLKLLENGGGLSDGEVVKDRDHQRSGDVVPGEGEGDVEDFRFLAVGRRVEVERALGTRVVRGEHHDVSQFSVLADCCRKHRHPVGLADSLVGNAALRRGDLSVYSANDEDNDEKSDDDESFHCKAYRMEKKKKTGLRTNFFSLFIFSKNDKLQH